MNNRENLIDNYKKRLVDRATYLEFKIKYIERSTMKYELIYSHILFINIINNN